MAFAVRRPRTARAAGLTNERLMQLVRFPYVRKAISSALERATPEKVEVGHGGAYVRFRVADPGSFHRELFATIPVGKRGTLLVIGTPKSEIRRPAALAAFIRRLGHSGLRSEARRSLIYQLRTAGIIGGSRTQAVLVPRHRVAQVAGKFAASSSGRSAAANPILATIGFNPGKTAKLKCSRCGRPQPHGVEHRFKGKPVCYECSYITGHDKDASGRTQWEPPFPQRRANPLTTKESVDLLRQAKYMEDRARRTAKASAKVYYSGEARGLARAVQRYGIKRAGGAADRIGGRSSDTAFKAGAYSNPGAAMVEIKIPFREGQHVTTEQIEAWISSLPHGAFRRAYESRFQKAKAQYKRFHLGSLPPYWKFTAFGFGANTSITDVDFVVSEGKEWAAPYQVSPRSGKYDPKVQGRYIHAHGDSKMEIDIKRAASTKRLPERFHTADGKFVGVIPSKNVKITDWYRG